MGGRSPLSSCGRRRAPPPPVAVSANPIFLQHQHRSFADADVSAGSDVADFRSAESYL